MPRSALSSLACPEGTAFFTAAPRGTTFTAVVPDYNIEEEWRFHGSPYNCATNRVSAVRSTAGRQLTAYHTYPFSSKEVYSVVIGEPTVEGLTGSSFDCDRCFESEIHFTSLAPEPGFVGNLYMLQAIYGPHDEYGVPADVYSLTSGICTLNRSISPAVATFHSAGTCTFHASHYSCGVSAFSGDGSPGGDGCEKTQSFQVTLPWSATADAGTNVQVVPVDPDGSGLGGSVVLEFEDVETPGTVSMTFEPVSEDSEIQAPANFSLGEPPYYYNITLGNGLAFEGSVRVCITYAEGRFDSANGDPELLHWNGDADPPAWEVLPNQTHDPATRTVCADTDSFSPFAVAQMMTDSSGKGKAKAKAKGKN